MSKAGKKVDVTRSTMLGEVDPMDCPFKEFRDNELAIEYWGLGPSAFRAAALNKVVTKPPVDYIWSDEQTQPLPRSVRNYLNGWVRAEELAMSRWDAEVVLFEEANSSGKMSIIDIQLSHAQVLLRSSFCRKVLSTCYMLERVEELPVEHQWENFIFSLGPEGWRARYHIYSPGMKAGGGVQHRPGISKCGCYLVRLFHLGAWRCIWVSDQVPVDATDSPLLPFSPLMSHAPVKSAKQVPALVTSSVVHLWPLLLCKALLKLAAPDMNSDEEIELYLEDVEDELMSDFDMLHALTGSLSMVYIHKDVETLWQILTAEVQPFVWDEDDETVTSTVKSKTTKKPTNKTAAQVPSTRAVVSVDIEDTKEFPPYALPGITPAHEMTLLVSMVRDVPLKKPLPEPEVSPWKVFRWVDWARRHGLYEAYDCPRTRFLKVNGLMKLSYSPHLLDVQSTESITYCFREEQEKLATEKDKKKKDLNRSNIQTSTMIQQQKEELREWVQYSPIQELILSCNVVYYPSMFQFTTTASNPPLRITKAMPNRALDIPASKAAPLYLQIDGSEEIKLRISLNMLHPRVLFNCGIPIVDYIEKGYVLMEVFEWFKDTEVPMAKAYIETRGYNSVEITLDPGRHFCRLWIHARMTWHAALLSESTLLLGTRDLIMTAAVRECPWVTKFLTHLGCSISNWLRTGKSTTSMLATDRDFFTSYQPDLNWDPKVVGYNKYHVHWMFRQALQNILHKRLQHHEYQIVCAAFRRHLLDPDFGLPPKPLPPKSLREIAAADICDCVMPETEEHEGLEEQQQVEEQVAQVLHIPIAEGEEKSLTAETLTQLLSPPGEIIPANICDLANDKMRCAFLKREREKVIRMHEAATLLQAHWRGTWARKCLMSHAGFTNEVIKLVMENAVGNIDVLTSLMNEFFTLFPGAKHAYSVSSALSGIYGLNQYHGTSPITPKCKWIPYFQGVFYAHLPVKVHFDIQSSLQHSRVAVYNNDTGLQMPQAYNAHVTFDFQPNNWGYTVMGHGSVHQHHHGHNDVHWQLTVLTSIDNVFHVCDNPDQDLCTILPLTPSAKLHLEEIFLPNRRNILGGITISVMKVESISFRAAATSPDLDIEAVLRTTNPEGEVEEIARCTGKGEICWPYMRLKPTAPILTNKRSYSHANITASARDSFFQSARSLKEGKKAKPASAGGKSKSATKIKETSKPAPIEPKQYTIEVTAPNGWPLTVTQWRRVDEVRNDLESMKAEAAAKKPTKDKGISTKEKKDDKDKPPILTIHPPNPGDAYVELECSTAIGGGALARRDDERDILFANTRRSWDAKEPGRNMRGAHIRDLFREDFLVVLPSPTVKTESYHTVVQEEGMFDADEDQVQQHGPSPVTDSGLLEMTLESEEEAKYYVMPEILRDKFVPLYYVPLCTKEKLDDESVLVTPDIAEAAKKERHLHIEAALERMRELQVYNEIYVLGRQKRRCRLLEKIFIDSQWTPELAQVLGERDEAVAREALEISANAKKKLEQGKKQEQVKKQEQGKKK